ncbi:fasciclin domain-containing protein [Nostoc favosum]|uniref:Fasciclin domain-containing protein n=1 Tax=Nostoc favosum CHAB5714 TaxID=2780399 RepID=A0ABS8I3G7_9NOSO|nr:fasciclin domain-containing protein [Nostoc favosum]MCC5598706.1 fasciclin domain-containing protein [Nostoc favosum CHAB5714]
MLGFVPQPNLHSLRFLALTELYWSLGELQKINYPIFGIKTTFALPAPCPKSNGIFLEVPSILIAAIQAAKGVENFKGNSPFMPTDETFIELQASTINVLLKDILKLNKTSILKL